MDGYYPVFAERLCAKTADENDAAHAHELSGVLWWMPSTGLENQDYWHGNYLGTKREALRSSGQSKENGVGKPSAQKTKRKKRVVRGKTTKISKKQKRNKGKAMERSKSKSKSKGKGKSKKRTKITMSESENKGKDNRTSTPEASSNSKEGIST